ncbi:hypothetical protein [Catelliglobosispora koreensis]|uniref:hypothetical protein n=1 Tax=Catelliglobosispora koreensis TaxID=129052 RepID=UPI000380DB77|nr:hypothetical protein [Catelliglobosispora koreensis]
MTRPTLREPHPVRPSAVLCGAIAAGVWLLAFGTFGVTLRGYLGWTLLSGGLAWVAAVLLSARGDRGVAVGVAAATGVAWAVATLSVFAEWARMGAWPV